MAEMDLPGSQSYFEVDLPALLSLLMQSNYDCHVKQVGLKGESMQLVTPSGLSSVEWMRGSLAAQRQQPLTWHKV